jgi:hypothetical protein
MRKYVLKWSNLGKAKDLYSILRGPVSLSDKSYPQLRKSGIYLFLDDQKGVIDVGEANAKRRGLRTRVRNEIYPNSYFAHKLRELGMDSQAQRDLAVKVATVEEGIDFLEESPEEVDSHLRLIESALICETDPWSNSHGGIDKWRREEVEVVNSGDHDPLAPDIVMRKGKECQKKWSRK